MPNVRHAMPLGKYTWKDGQLVEVQPSEAPKPTIEIDPAFAAEAKRQERIVADVDVLLSGDRSLLVGATARLEQARSPRGLMDAMRGEIKSKEQQIAEEEAKVEEAAAQLRASNLLKTMFVQCDNNPNQVEAKLRQKVTEAERQVKAALELGQKDVAAKLAEDHELFTRAQRRLAEISG